MPPPLPGAREKSATARRRKLAVMRAGMRTLGAVSPALAARAAETLFRTPPPHTPWEGERALLSQGEPAPLSVRGMPVAAWTWGKGDPVLLVHGWGSRGARLGSFVAPLVAAGHRVVAFDAPGHGGSDRRRSSLPEFIFTIEAAHEVHGPFAAIVAHSLGGASAALAMARGVRAGRAVFLAPAADPAGYTRRFAEIIGIDDRVRERMEAQLVRRFGLRWPEFDVLEAARRVTTPLLVFHDQGDSEIPLSDGAAIVKAWRGAELVTTRGLGHRRIVHDPNVLARAVAFLLERGGARVEGARETSA